MIIAVGIDLVSIGRMERAYRRRPRRLLRRLFTTAELTLLLPRRAFFPALAARFAAKEAVLKTIGSGPGPLSWQEVEIIAPPGMQPRVRLSGAAAGLAAARGIGEIALSMTHEPPFAAAIAVAYKNPPEDHKC